MTFHRFPTELRGRIGLFFRHVWKLNSCIDEKAIFDNLPTSLRIEVPRCMDGVGSAGQWLVLRDGASESADLPTEVPPSSYSPSPAAWSSDPPGGR